VIASFLVATMWVDVSHSRKAWAAMVLLYPASFLFFSSFVSFAPASLPGLAKGLRRARDHTLPEAKAAESSFLVIWVYITAAAYVPAIYLSAEHGGGRWSLLVEVAIAGMSAVTVFIACIVILALTFDYLALTLEGRAARSQPHGSIVRELLAAVTLLEHLPPPWRDGKRVAEINRSLESAARMMAGTLPHTWPAYDEGTDGWTHQRGERLAAGIRRFKKQLIMRDAAALNQLRHDVATQLSYAIQGDWVRMAEADAEVMSKRDVARFRVIPLVRTMLLALGPGAAFLVVQQTPAALPSVAAEAASPLFIGYTIVSLMQLVDPKFETRVSSLKGVTGFIPSGKSGLPGK
jgi:hypothetical protein